MLPLEGGDAAVAESAYEDEVAEEYREKDEV
jgi:hypothetical protein